MENHHFSIRDTSSKGPFSHCYVSLPECNCILGGFPYFSPPFEGLTSVGWSLRVCPGFIPWPQKNPETWVPWVIRSICFSSFRDWNEICHGWNDIIPKFERGCFTPEKTNGWAPENTIPNCKKEKHQPKTPNFSRFYVSFPRVCSCFIPLLQLLYTTEI